MSHQPRRIAFISHLGLGHTGWGGSEELWYQTALRLAKAGFQVGVNCHRYRPRGVVQKLVEAGCQVTTRSDRPLLEKVFSKLSRRDSLGQWLQKFAPHLAVISQGSNLDGVGWMETCLNLGVPYAVISQAASDHYWLSDELIEPSVRAYQGAKRCFFVSHHNLALTQKQLALDLPQARVVRNPYKVSYQAKPAWCDRTDKWQLACVGRLEPMSKGQDLLFEVLRLDKWRQRPLEVTLFGDGNCQASLQRLQQFWQLDQVKFGGFSSDIEALWSQHHALVLPSRYEGLPLAVVEAMLCGRVCIVTVAGAELIQDNVNGFIATAASAHHLDEAMERAWHQRASWQAMGQAAATWARTLIPPDPIDKFMGEIQGLVQ